ncbi:MULTISPECIES: DUF2510 domain-containing protein [unclassified Streptomyces]|uniref:DUF2510 domain-containing protein n=1 Tax=unclassified Streptomyces TaxID=2593676 RepID=UPI00333429C8
MTQVTPPGWYPDPGQTNDGPAAERWWDGKAWTDRTRPAGSAGEWGPPTEPPYGGAYPAYPAVPPPAPRRTLRTGIAVAVAVAVLAAIGVGAYALSDNGSGNGTRANPQQAPNGQGGTGGQGGPEGQGGSGGTGGPNDPFGGSGGTGGSGGATPAPSQSAQPKVPAGGNVTDSLDGISLPVPSDWYGQVIQIGAQVTSNTSYKCPGNTSQTCTNGGAYSAPAVVLGTKGSTAEAVAKADIAANAKESYGGTTYGSITSHEVLASKAVTVAGQKGYLVRWKAVTSKGADGYVESLAFPSPASTGQIVVVRFGVDVGQKQSVIDEITSGIKVSSGTGDGGQKI